MPARDRSVRAAAPREERRRRLAAAAAPPPRGQRETVAALVDATIGLLAERGPAAVSVRDIAARAGVNHGLVHRHFGSKQELVRAALDRLAGELFDAAGAAPLDVAGLSALFTATARHEAYWRALARTVLDGDAPRAFQSRFPTIRRVVEALEGMQRSGALTTDVGAPLLTAGLGALVLGWLVFEPFLLAATDLDRRARDENRGALLAALLTILGRLGGEGRSPR
jgi:AcrR family transcriptional regulator